MTSYQLVSLIVLLLSWTIPQQPFSNGDLCTPDNPDFREYRFKESVPICKRNVDYSKRQKVYDKYNVDKRLRYQYTIDHIIPLSLGGSNSFDNLWPQHKSIYTGNIEGELYNSVRNGTISYHDAICEIVQMKKIDATIYNCK